jgi:hydroxyacylglutathione hydrolase
MDSAAHPVSITSLPPGRMAPWHRGRPLKRWRYVGVFAFLPDRPDVAISSTLGNSNALVIETPGHTRGHISYLFPEDGIVFVGDTLFSVGCGKLLEGDARMMWHSLQKLMALPPETQLYCGHEYTRANAKFALTVEPGNAALQARAVEAEELAKKRQPALPTTIGRELATNPFLRPSSPEIQKRLGMEGRELWEVFGETRRRKDKF